jgi:hypothetical protein
MIMVLPQNVISTMTAGTFSDSGNFGAWGLGELLVRGQLESR